MALDEDRNVILARVAERAERYDEMADYMRERALTGMPLNQEERDMFSAAFKGALTGRRQAVRIAVSVQQAELERGSQATANLALGYKSKVEAELSDICNKALGLLDKLVVAAEPGEAKTFYLKMQGDYYRYIAEFAGGDQRSRAAANAKQAYMVGLQEAEVLSPVQPVRLGLALNFSVFQHEVLGDTPAAIFTAKNALRDAASATGSVSEETKNDAMLTMQLLQDNLSLWEPEAANA
mmetsp:Transcript_10530/g.23927  ORF Transcript_10530/g.23927 Transcript_10530/m.23927 type:complete len:238 (+) Transcript_10530:128-841(+)|eukprot:CAMPEP_0178408118 /NCGR_PEP_ID=MMETSP0689_2-20121128/19775_1 /TAXON_ID=160604 /ORGANISM="Amphidinium massartii, Strain CS-259" /LENGTH=237 /DNA_ID=CAMNT_0020029205 /DNA_START=59 /DNA_END=772 /DNA_ORIENTATION=-